MRIVIGSWVVMGSGMVRPGFGSIWVLVGCRPWVVRKKVERKNISWVDKYSTVRLRVGHLPKKGMSLNFSHL